MLRKTFWMLFALTFVLGACKKKEDEDCVAASVDKNIVGSWTANYTSSIAPAGGPLSANFKSDGTLEGDFTSLAVLITGKPMTDFKWAVNNGNVEISGKDSGGVVTTNTLTVKENTCEKIVLDYMTLVNIELKKQ